MRFKIDNSYVGGRLEIRKDGVLVYKHSLGEKEWGKIIGVRLPVGKYHVRASWPGIKLFECGIEELEYEGGELIVIGTSPDRDAENYGKLPPDLPTLDWTAALDKKLTEELEK